LKAILFFYSKSPPPSHKWTRLASKTPFPPEADPPTEEMGFAVIAARPFMVGWFARPAKIIKIYLQFVFYPRYDNLNQSYEH
jgi:hypothetical protein